MRVAGVVTDDGTGAPVDGAAVRLADPSGSVRETLTGPAGAFAFEAVPPGAYVLGVRRIGYEVLSTPLEVGPDAQSLDVRIRRYRLCDLPGGAEVELAAAYGPHGSEAILIRAAEGGAVKLGVPVTPPGSIAGVVIHRGTGRPLSRVRIELVGTDFGAVANGSEGFLLQGLPPGPYRVRASCSGFDPAERSVELAEGGQIRVELMLEPRNRRVRRCGR